MNRKPYLYTVLFSFILLATAPFASAARVPFKGEMSGDVVGTPTGQDVDYAVDLAGTGKATVLGKFTVMATHITDGATGLFTGGSMSFVNKQGDTLTGTYAGQENYDTGDPDIVLATATITITGGTGRFAGATGTVVITALVTIQEITDDFVYIETFEASFDGRIEIP